MIPYLGIEKIERKKNKVRNENINRIKLPCFCTYESNKGKRRLGIIVNDWFQFFGKDDDSIYSIVSIDKQTPKKIGNKIASRCTLKELIEEYKVNIIKAKIRVFEDI